MIYKSEIKVSDVDERIQTLKNSKNIVVFGTGNYGALAHHALKELGINIDCFCDNNEDNWGTDFIGHKVISPDELINAYPEAVVLIASLRFKYMAQQLESATKIMVLNCDFLFGQLDLTNIVASTSLSRLRWMLNLYMFAVSSNNDTESIKVKSLDIVVTEKCTLKCQDCSNLMQYYEKPIDNELDLMLASLQKFMTNVDELHEARVIGGEPFMYKRLPQLMNQLLSYGNCKNITIFTNGTIVPKGEMLESIKNDKVSLIISDYGSLSKNTAKLKAVLDENGISYIAYEVDFWQDCAKVYYRERTHEELKKVFGDCCVNDALTLLHGQLYACPFSAHVTNLKAIPPEAYDDEVVLVDLSDDELKMKIRAMHSADRYLNACTYCAGRDYSVGRIEAALQTKAPLPLKTYPIKEQR
ncbi:MAG: hypothetical protein COS82_06765 [Zetaproteobacteria bacterium CG06_land_8_20_14_3_00_59_53]|nr:MAG: hypothetical protein AUK36_03690 [Zetaproteobacteria bacterium CG2_30_59_37]PIO89907.1 MAG: hypothetical protein COX56_05900 [Zetaproteobacteria bacterium CG23_combo_of_CG06-09_8_20_14_all_59_86]PIU70381.1 MAG: hypothetical protein COS82_06765 [Zetaproteobacteria bacterium CG06_land_8_20_14_3_00_59_53]PIU97495.1 MAG: hypothetical protein COS62_03780 [Zetaproteobacteria bacterium CG03_land_8_20_14_0_80_59_51]PIY46591.1 MAG: hypothetical protein COZ02_04845 [Zetaproteobacteria bacterium C